jgi:hypothetical protein
VDDPFHGVVQECEVRIVRFGPALGAGGEWSARPVTWTTTRQPVTGLGSTKTGPVRRFSYAKRKDPETRPLFWRYI